MDPLNTTEKVSKSSETDKTEQYKKVQTVSCNKLVSVEEANDLTNSPCVNTSESRTGEKVRLQQSYIEDMQQINENLRNQIKVRFTSVFFFFNCCRNKTKKKRCSESAAEHSVGRHKDDTREQNVALANNEHDNIGEWTNEFEQTGKDYSEDQFKRLIDSMQLQISNLKSDNKFLQVLFFLFVFILFCSFYLYLFFLGGGCNFQIGQYLLFVLTASIKMLEGKKAQRRHVILIPNTMIIFF
ncbi:hypothetical protein RFI_15771 [Reticulomyxa filosa]|uniref:Uncharacterized protein n=1 Tax=Reticulomyxa filosa TaxID=46433 RepID=X6N6S4_RETFI|nr:hypothetical protein RFI_15771 [Reticulomyxa filosa]|eukprot:ETO21434.1 hypothetical protein RFI_15771 [Reticulomyxa filosa]